MRENPPIVVDTNILISALIKKKSAFIETLNASKYQFYICESTIIELFKHKDRIMRYSELSEDEIAKAYYFLLKRVNIFKEDLIEKNYWEKAFQLCKDVDEADTPFVALTLELGGLLYSGDKKLKNHLKRKNFNAFFESAKRMK